jgi:RNA polymerase sigma factor (sigma-70 family)
MDERVSRSTRSFDPARRLEWVRNSALLLARGYLRECDDRDGVAEEIAQETLLEVTRLVENGTIGSGDDLRRLSWSVARRRAIDRCRRIERRRAISVSSTTFSAIDPIATLATAGASPSSLAGRRELYNALLDEAARLPPRRRHALLLYFVSGLTTTEIGRALGLSRTAAANEVQRATIDLRARWRLRSTGQNASPN